MTLRVLRRVKEKAQHGRRQSRSSDFTCLQKSRFVGRPQLAERRFNGAIDYRAQTRDSVVTRIGASLGRQRLPLRRRELLTARVAEQSVEAPHCVPRVKTDRCRATRARPELSRRQSRDRRVHVSAALQQAMRDRLQQGWHTGDGTAEPEFGFGHSQP